MDVACPAILQADQGLLAMGWHALADFQEIVEILCRVHLSLFVCLLDSLCAGDWCLLLQANHYVGPD